MFGTDGIRGIVDSDIDSSLAYKIGKAISLYIEKNNLKNEVIIGFDTRVSNHTLAYALGVGVIDYGVNVSIVGVVPTAAISYLSRNNNAIGVMITASHNSKEYNGIKIIDNEGYKITSFTEQVLKNLLNKRCKKPFLKGKVCIEPNYKKTYIEYLNKYFGSLESKFTYVFDTAFGSNYDIDKTILKLINLNYKLINNKPSGELINDGVGAEHIEHIKDYIKNKENVLGFAFDGDADRLRVVDSSNYVYTGDEIIYVLAKYLKKQNKLYRNAVVGTEITSKSLEVSLSNIGVKLIRVKVGDKNIIECMKNNGYALGGEDSGHICMLEYNTTSDALFNALYLIKVLEFYKKPLKSLLKDYKKFDRITHNIKVSKEYKTAFYNNKSLQTNISSFIENHLSYNIIVRPSGTENLIRIVVEGDKLGFDNIIKELTDIILEKNKG